MTDREIFEKETGLTEPKANIYSPIKYLSDHGDYWKAYAKWLEKRSEWVSVEDSLPDNNVKVLLKGKFEDEIQLGFRSGIEWYEQALDHICNVQTGGSFCEFDISGITHWRPLPTPPDEAKRGRG